MADYLIYPFKTMNISQTYSNGEHLQHNTGFPKDYPIDEAGADTGRDWFYCPCAEMIITKLYGTRSIGYHIWLESTSKVSLANGKSDYITIMAVHADYDDYSRLKVGKLFKFGSQVFKEGTSGNATGNHIHMSIGAGKSSSNSEYWEKNSKEKWVLITPNGPLKPEEAFFVDAQFTDMKRSKGLAFKILQGDNDMSRGYFKLGDANEGVYALKQMLIELKQLGKISQAVNDDNIFGDGTEKAVKEVQKAAKLTVDGYAGPVTIKACRELISDSSDNLNKKIVKANKELSEAKLKISRAKKALR